MPVLDLPITDYRAELHYLCSIVPQQFQAAVHAACLEDFKHRGIPYRSLLREGNRNHWYELPPQFFAEGNKTNLVFRFLHGNGAYTAPTLDNSSIETGKVDRLYPTHDFIVRLVSEEEKTIWNVTLPHHILFPGFVRIQVVNMGHDTGVVVTGVGRGNLAQLNETVLGPLMFTALPQLGKMMFSLEQEIHDLTDRAAETVYGWEQQLDTKLKELYRTMRP